MNTSVHLPQEISDRLNTYTKYHSVSKNKVIVEAIERFLAEKEDQDAWHPDILNWQGIKDDGFDLELDRDFLLSSRENIF